MLSLSDITLFSLSLSSGDRLFISDEASLLSAARFIVSRLNFPPDEESSASISLCLFISYRGGVKG